MNFHLSVNACDFHAHYTTHTSLPLRLDFMCTHNNIIIDVWLYALFLAFPRHPAVASFLSTLSCPIDLMRLVRNIVSYGQFGFY